VPDRNHIVGFGGTNGAQPRSRTACTPIDAAIRTAIAA
jgi:hypothetical protein